MSLIQYDVELAKKELTFRILPPTELTRRILETSHNEVETYGRAIVPFGLIRMFRSRFAEINRDNLDGYERGRLLVAEEQMTVAEALFKKALDSGDERACANLGIIQETRGNVAEALKLYERGQDSSSKNSLGNYWEMQGHHRKAEKYYHQAAGLAAEENSPGYGGILVNAGKAHISMGNTKRAIDLFQTAANDYGYYEGYMEIYRCAIEHHQFDLAMATLFKASQRGYGPAIIQSALILLVQGEQSKANDMFELAEQLGYRLNDDQNRLKSSIQSRSYN